MANYVFGKLTQEDIARAWHDHEYRATLDQAEVNAFMALPEDQRIRLVDEATDAIGLMELTDDELEAVAGGLDTVDVDVKSCWIASC
ncbi:MAG: hypothetical protein AB1791_02135 [Chloroflexota bacterium]